MDKTASQAFVYAKASGILGKSFINDKVSNLFEVKSLSELWTLLFKSQVPALPEKLLADEIEKEAFKRFINQYVSFISSFDSLKGSEEILLNVLYIYESENLKEIADSLCANEIEMPSIIDLGQYNRLNYSAWPDIKSITEKSPYKWLNTLPDIHEKQKIEYKIDLQTVADLWASLEKTRGQDRKALFELYENEYIIKNIVWALRLKIFYKMKDDEILNNLIYVKEAGNPEDPLLSPVLKILKKEVDSYQDWEDWKYSDLINPHISGEVWSIDPNWIEKSNRVKMNKLAMRIFHQNNMSTASLVAWFKIKSFELSCIRTAVESFRLGINSSQALDLLGIN